MTEQLPEPLVPADVDLRGYEFMPLYGDRLLGSETWIAASAEAKIAALRLWWRSYAHEVPAGSLPDNDNLLADYAGYGVAVKAWRKVRPQALRGWVKCTDGRWYHPFVATLVMEAWQMRQAHAHRTLKGRIGALEKRLKEAKTAADKAHIQSLLQPLQQSLSQTNAKPVTDNVNGLLQGRTGQDRTGQDIKTKDQKPPALAVAEPIFGEWIDFLQRKGVSPDSARTFIGLMRKGYGDELVVEVMQEAERQDITNPKPWVSKALQVRSVKRDLGQQSEPSQTTKAMIALQSMKVET